MIILVIFYDIFRLKRVLARECLFSYSQTVVIFYLYLQVINSNQGGIACFTESDIGLLVQLLGGF